MISAGKLAATMITGLVVWASGAIAAETVVTVFRGTESGAAADQQQAGLPVVLRGMPVASRQPADTQAPEPDGDGWTATGGEALWLVERDGGQVLGCWLQGSSQAGMTDVRCGEGVWR